MEILPSKAANYMLRLPMCACVCVCTLNTGGLGQYCCVLLGKVLRVSHPLGNHPASNWLIIHFVSHFNQYPEMPCMC